MIMENVGHLFTLLIIFFMNNTLKFLFCNMIKNFKDPAPKLILADYFEEVGEVYLAKAYRLELLPTKLKENNRYYWVGRNIKGWGNYLPTDPRCYGGIHKAYKRLAIALERYEIRIDFPSPAD